MSNSKTRARILMSLALLALAALSVAPNATHAAVASARPQGPCDIYAAAGDPCIAAHSTTRALFAGYSGPLYQVMRQLDGKKQTIGVVAATAADPGGYADAAAQDRFCANTICWITTIFDQARKGNDLTQAPRGAFSGPAMGGFNNIPVADMAPASLNGHKVYGVFIEPGMGLRQNDAKGTAVDDQAEGQYWVINGHHFNNGCCFDYGNAEIDSKDDGNGTMETAYYGDATAWYHGTLPGPWPMTDQENNLVGCVNPDPADKLCKTLPQITWRFVTAMAKGEPHHWTSLSGDAQQGDLLMIYDGARVNNTYDPMRKQGAILLGNGGDNSVGSQGTFYEGAMTKGGTFPSNETDQKVQANVVAAHYGVAALNFVVLPGMRSFVPGTAQDVTLNFTNATQAPVSGVAFNLALPKGWTVTAAPASFTASAPVAPGASVSAVFHVTSAAAAFNGDLGGKVSFTANGRMRSEATALKVRNTSPVKINEFHIADGPANATNSFIELYNAGAGAVDISGWTLTQHQAQQVPLSNVKVPAGTMLAGKGFYLLGLANSGLAAPARAGDGVIAVRSIAGIKVGDSITVDGESRSVTAVGTAAGAPTTIWQPLPDGPVLAILKGAKVIPVTSTAGFVVGEKIALGHGATYPAVNRNIEQLEIATIAAVGKPGTMAFLGADAAKGSTTLSVTSVSGITAGDRIRLDIATMGHGVETVTVKRVGTAASFLALATDAKAGATSLRIRPGTGTFNGQTANAGTAPAIGDTLIVGMPDAAETVTITAVNGQAVDVRPALSRNHLSGDAAAIPGTGLTLAAPLKFNHAANLPFSAPGTGLTLTAPTQFAHASNEPVIPLGTGLTLDRPLSAAHAVDAAVRDAAVTTAGYQSNPAPNQWFGGPALSPAAGAMILRDARGLVVDSLNYGLLVDPWAAEGYQGQSGVGAGGCRVTAPGGTGGNGPQGQVIAMNRSAARLPDGADSDSNCTDFRLQPATVLPIAAAAGATNLKVAGVADFVAGQTIIIDNGASRETAVIAMVGTAGSTTADAASAAGTTTIAVTSPVGFAAGQTITIDGEPATVSGIAGGRGGARLTLAAPLASAHAAGASVAGTGITLRTPLGKAHAAGTQVNAALPTPGAPNASAAVAR